MRIAFLGTPKISAYVLEELSKVHEIIWAISQPDKPAGRGNLVLQTPVKELSINKNFKIYQPDKISKKFFKENIESDSIDAAIVIAYGQYIPTYLIEHPKFFMLNIHLSLLPKYRGSAPVQRAILNDDKQTGVSIMKVSKIMDAGATASQITCDIDLNISTEELTWNLVKNGTEELLNLLKKPELLRFTEQDEKNVSYAAKIQKQDAEFSWSDTPLSIHNKVRSLSNWPGVFTKINDKILKIKKTKLVENSGVNIDKALSGEILKIDKKVGVYVKAGTGVILLEKVQPLGKEEMSISAYINGNKIIEGMIFL